MIKAVPTSLDGIKGYFIPDMDFVRLMRSWQEIENFFAKVDNRKPERMIQTLSQSGGTS